jgi:hypothetical protein
VGLPYSVPTFTPDVLDGRVIDLLGRVQGVALGSASSGTQTTIFLTGNMDYRGKTIFIAYVSLDLLTVTNTADGVRYAVKTGPIDAGVKADFGANGGFDWLGATPLDFTGQSSPSTAYAGQLLSGSFVLPVYAQGVNFTVVNRSTGASSQVGQFSAWGWAYG